MTGLKRTPMKITNSINRVIIFALFMTTISSGAVAQWSFYYNDESPGTTGVVKPSGHYERWMYFGAAVEKTAPLIAQALRPQKNAGEKKREKEEPEPKPVPVASVTKPDLLKLSDEDFKNLSRNWREILQIRPLWNQMRMHHLHTRR